MIKVVYIVHIHPVELGRPNLYKVEREREFDKKIDAERYIFEFNVAASINNVKLKAVYVGAINDETGELL